MRYDVCVIGGGIVGLATAYQLLQLRPGLTVVVLEKEDEPARHQTGHNSGVVHAGIYYQPGSLKARLCRAGAQRTKEFCAEHDIPIDVRGKLLVATDDREAARMDALLDRAQVNGIAVHRMDATELREREPNVAGLGALHVKDTAIVDFPLVARKLATLVEKAGGQVVCGVEVDRIDEGPREVRVTAGEREWTTGRLVVCAGLQADRLARLAGVRTRFQIVPFRGEYYRLPDTRRDVVHHLIYPIPDPDLPFLGVHLTPMIDGSLTVGPSAVLAMSREGYAKFSVTGKDVREYATFPGMWRVARSHFRTGLAEVRNSLSKRSYLAACRKYCPSLTVADLLPYEAGIRAQAVLRDGTLVHDFLVEQTPRTLHVCNAPSPAATSALPIGEMIARRCLDE